MKVKERKIDIILIVLLAITCVLTLFVLSNATRVKAASTSALSEIKTTGEFTYWVAYHPYAFINLDVSEIFALNNTTSGHEGLRTSQTHDKVSNKYEIQPTQYALSMCTYHSQHNGIGEAYYDDIVNIIDIETTGKITAWKKNQTASKETTITDPTERQSIAAFCYMLYQANLYQREFIKNKENNTGTLMDKINQDSDISSDVLRYYYLYNDGISGRTS